MCSRTALALPLYQLFLVADGAGGQPKAAVRLGSHNHGTWRSAYIDRPAVGVPPGWVSVGPGELMAGSGGPAVELMAGSGGPAVELMAGSGGPAASLLSAVVAVHLSW